MWLYLLFLMVSAFACILCPCQDEIYSLYTFKTFVVVVLYNVYIYNILIYLKFILDYSLRYGSNHILLPDSLQLTQQFLMNNIYLSPLIQYENFRESISH